MITNNTYYKGDIYIPQAKPSITEGATEINAEFAFMIEKYEEDCLIKCLGHQLYMEFAEQLDTAQANLLKVGADEKWDRLLNGYTYTRQGESSPVSWLGIRRKIPLSGAVYNYSFLANYVYFFYQRKQYITTTGTGTGIERSENLIKVAPTQKVVEAWNDFVLKVQGKQPTPKYYYNNAGFTGVDFYVGENQITLYQFIKDMNTIVDDYYQNFKPTEWEFLNKFGI